MSLQVDPVFLGATRPSMLAGVTTEFLLVNGGLAAVVYVATNNPLWLLMFIPLHSIAWVLCRNEPRALTLLVVWLSTKATCRTRNYWHASTYTPFNKPRGRKPNGYFS